MIGKLVQTEDNQWYIVIVEEGDWKTLYPLHPDDVNFCNSYGDYSVDWIGKEVEFEIVENNKMSGVSLYAKLK